MALKQDFDYIGTTQTWIVPANVTKITVELYGAAGGGQTGGEGIQGVGPALAGQGGYVKGDVVVTPGETLTLVLGGSPGTSTRVSAGSNGGATGGAGGGGISPALEPGFGGGGMTEIRRGATKLAVAGGGGGGGGGFSINGSKGGNGGGTAGSSPGSGGGNGGGAGTTGAGGSAGSAGTSGAAGNAGTSGNGGGGGSGGSTMAGGGGGGGGYFGGGGGGSAAAPTTNGITGWGGGGGGGASYSAGMVGGTVTAVNGGRYGNGRVIISYPEPAPNTPTNLSPAAGSTMQSDTPLLGAYISTNYSAGVPQQGKVKVEWQIAKDQLFTISARTFLQPDAELKYAGEGASIQTTFQIQGADRLPQGTWYLRARAIDWNGTSSQYSGYQTFRIANLASTLAWSPTNNEAVQFNASGQTLSWVYANSNLGSQSAYQVIVEDAGGATIIDTGKTTSSVTQTVVLIPAAQKTKSLRWKVKVWDSDGVEGAYSSYNIFRVADLPTVIVDAVGTVANPNPTFSYTATPKGSPLTARRLYVTRDSDGAVFYDSGWVS